MVLRVLHLTGSAVSDFYADLSRLYTRDCLAATADPSRYDVQIAYVTPDRKWRFPTDLTQRAIDAAAPMSLDQAVGVLVDSRIDVMVPQMFCVPGLTSYRGLFDLLHIPYLGNTPVTMSLAINKAKAKAVVAAAGVSVPRGEVLRRGDTTSIPPPAVVKPVDADNSLGVGLVRRTAEYGPALTRAFEHGQEALVETYIPLGREVRCGVLQRDGQLICLPLEEYSVDPVTKPIRHHDDKIKRTPTGELALVAKDPTKAWIVDTADPLTQPVWEVARACHTAMGCRDYSLFDFRVDPDGNPWFLEAGLYCSFARQSVISVMAAAAGLPIDDLFATALQQSATTSSQPV